MSFSKAKIQRFNELGSEAPPPGAYDPKFGNKVKGLVIEKADRFLETKSLCSAECGSSISGKGSVSIPVFRTPQLTRKRIIIKPMDLTCSKIKDKATPLIKSQNMKYESAQELLDLQVECQNKDKTIQEHEKHIEEMKNDVRKLEAELEELRKKQSEIEKQHTKDIETMAKLQQMILDNHDEKHQAEKQILASQLLEVSEEKEREISARKIMEMELRTRAAELSRRITILEVDKKEENKVKIEILETRIEELLNTLKKIEHDHAAEVTLLDEEKCQLNVCVTDLIQERNDLEAKLEKRQNVILQLQAQLSALQCELDELKAEYEKLADDSIKRISDLTDKHETEITHLRNTFLKEQKELVLENDNYKMHELEVKIKVNELTETNSFLMEELEDVQRLYKDMCQRLHEAQRELELADEKHVILIERHKKDLLDIKNTHTEEKLKLEQLLRNTTEEYLKELESITVAKDKEVEELKQVTTKKIEEETKRVTEHAQKMIENAEAVTRETLAACRIESEARMKRVIVECDAKVNTMIREAQNTVEEEMRLAVERYEVCLAHIEAERTTLDEKLSQRDAEITKLSVTLEELRSSVETQESFSQSLQVELDKAETELAEKKVELRSLKQHIRAEAAEMVSRRKRFEVIMAENQASVVALTNRLAQSNAEVERLQYELKLGEDCIHEHRDLLSAMHNNSKLVHEQVHILIKQLDAKKGLIDQFEAHSSSEIDSLKSVFEAKIENLQQIAAKEITRFQDDCEKKSIENAEIKKQLDEMANSLDKAQSLLLKLEERNDVNAIDISRMELENSKLMKQLTSQEQALQKNNQLLQDEATQHKIAIDEANSQIQELSEKIKSFEDKEKYAEETNSLLKQERVKWKTFESALMQKLQEERMKREEAEEEVSKFVELNSRIHKDYDEISKKYAEIVGHQNPKQRIKHVTQLKDKIYQLEQDLHSKTKLVEQQQKTIEKLKAEDKRSHGKGKENIGLVHSTPISSPHKPLTPLRNRND